MAIAKPHDSGVLCMVGRNPYLTNAFDLLPDQYMNRLMRLGEREFLELLTDVMNMVFQLRYLKSLEMVLR